MIKFYRTSLLAAGVVAAGSGYFARPAHAQVAVTDGTQAQKTAGSGQVGAITSASAQPVPESADNTPEVLTNAPGARAAAAAELRQTDRDSANPASRSASPRDRVPASSEFESYVSELAGKPLRRFGSELVVPDARGFTSPPNTAIPADYRVNAGDQIILDLTGSVQAVDLRLVVDKQGQIFVPKVGAITVAGVPYAQLQALIAARVSRQYRNFGLTVSLGELRGITVYVTGFVAHPGSYTVSSLSTLVNAVLAAGGPAPSGSFRSIQVRRGGRLVADFDLYDFLLKGDNRGDITLQNGDVVFMAPAGAQIAAIGSVNREAIYEARDKDTLTDILRYAGGANTVADLSRVHVFDPQSDNGWQQITPQVAAQTLARRGLVLRVLSAVGIAQPSRNLQSLVTVSGEVARPGRYFVAPGTTLDQVVQMAGGLTSEAYPFGAVFVRESLRREQQLDYAEATKQIQTTLLVEPLVHANSSAGQSSDYAGRRAIMRDLVDQLDRYHIDGRLVLPVSAATTVVPGGFIVENNDALFIPNRKLAVGVFGLVNSTADFQYIAGRRVRDYIAIAGGYARYADKHHVFVKRANGTVEAGSAALNAQVLPGDLIFVPVNPEQGAFWAHLRDLSGVLLNGLVAAAAIKAVSP